MEILLFILLWLLGSIISVIVYYFSIDDKDDHLLFLVFAMIGLVGSWVVVIFQLFIFICYGLIRIIKYLLKDR